MRLVSSHIPSRSRDLTILRESYLLVYVFSEAKK